MPCDQDRAMRVMHHIITDTTQNGSSNGSHSSGSHDDHLGAMFFRVLHDEFAGVREFRDYSEINLFKERKINFILCNLIATL